ncbi:Holliday junction branch migration protein RuvA [Pelagicoccus sp. SDUM812005]|uniref:Holliday junction branch migration protein RuvA n=1 Tax=Pelagicoccus sp. SDUM812005 TaxID=3041257 RepID=UPI00280DFD90|nr:Holliday junction branch migration protein RuvA [Pelagicoccus sp. SDUM812005]MDQ8179412.1 Holliday junction branch migration protein RuvA [Pelagicoccus sp. SDUM812005]
MIVSIEGILERATPLTAIINAGGLGYLVNIPVSTAAKLPPNGEKVRLHTHAVYREDSQALYGFASEDERNFFQLLIEKVSGVGPKVGISMMSKLELPSLLSAIGNEDAVLLAKTPGIGKKTAERVIIELKDKLSSFAHASSSPALQGMVTDANAAAKAGVNHTDDAVLALLALGYKQSDATKAVGKAVDALGPNASTEALIKAALG